MNAVDRNAVRAAILELAHSGDNDSAHAVWDMYDAYLENDLELVLKAGESEEVRNIERLISCTLVPPSITEAGNFAKPASDTLRRCPSHFLSTADEILVRCQNGEGHTDPVHTYETLDDPGYTWTNDQEFGFVDLNKPTELDQCTQCGSTETPHICAKEWFAPGNDGSALEATAPAMGIAPVPAQPMTTADTAVQNA